MVYATVNPKLLYVRDVLQVCECRAYVLEIGPYKVGSAR